MTETSTILEDYLNIADVMLIVIEADRKVKEINQNGSENLGYDKDEIVGKDWFDTFIPARDRAAAIEGFKLLMAGEGPTVVRYQTTVLTKKGEERLISWHNKVMKDKAGKITGTISSGEDITEKTRQVKSGRVATRALQTLSSGNRVLIGAQSLNELLDSICKVIVQDGGYPMAWVGMLDESGPRKHILAVTKAGDQAGYLEDVHITLEGDGPTEKGPMAMVFRTGKTAMLLFREVPADQLFWRQKALDRGYKSIISLPLKDRDRVIGALNIYAETEDAFDNHERLLLEQMADDVSYGINVITGRNEMIKALSEKNESDRRLTTLMGNIPGMAYRCRANQDRRMDFVSDSCRTLTGYEPADIIQNGKITYGLDIIHPDEQNQVWLMVQQYLSEGLPFKLMYKILKKDGSVRWVWDQGQGVQDNRGKLSTLEGYVVDITDQMKAQGAQRQRSKDEIFLFLASAIPAFASNISHEARDQLISNFAKRFEDNVKVKFMKDMAQKKRSHEPAKVDLPSYTDWLSDFFMNIGISTRTETSGGTTTLELLQCPWTDYAAGNPIFCQICRAIITRSFNWTGLTGQVEQKSSKAGGNEACKFVVRT